MKIRGMRARADITAPAVAGHGPCRYTARPDSRIRNEPPMNRTAQNIAIRSLIGGMARGADHPRLPAEPLSGKD
jgi:hypothetical protein